MRPLTTSLATIVLGLILAEPVVLVAFVVLAREHVSDIANDLVKVWTITVGGTCAVGWMLAKRLVRWAWQE